MYKKILLVLSATLAAAAFVNGSCTTDADCGPARLCVRSSVCLSSEQLRYLAETYVPVEAAVKVAQGSECKMAYECDEGFDRCSSMGQCLSDEKVAKYRLAATQAYKEILGSVELPTVESKKCVSNIQCLSGDICYQGVCQNYLPAMKEIKDTHERYMAAKAASAAPSSN